MTGKTIIFAHAVAWVQERYRHMHVMPEILEVEIREAVYSLLADAGMDPLDAADLEITVDAIGDEGYHRVVLAYKGDTYG